MQAAQFQQERADFRHVEAWIFDLDNTLYRADSRIFEQIDARMAAYVARLLGVDADDARRVQKAYYRDHGTTLNGLMQRHGVDPEEFLAQVHDIDLAALAPSPALNRAIGALPGRRFVFTNGCRSHAARVLDRIGLTPHIDEIWDIRTTQFQPKPFPSAYDTVVAQAKLAPARAAMFDDLRPNLAPARALGMTTVWIDTGSVWATQGPQAESGAAHSDHVTRDLSEFLHAIRIGP
ncbi:MAG: pyrimidine 5'-nucleotidase [Alphaproteobacteria bacterium]|nr:pyrimidine 5'-nucleotidase [Alphaproteobacteria bacterium]